MTQSPEFRYFYPVHFFYKPLKKTLSFNVIYAHNGSTITPVGIKVFHWGPDIGEKKMHALSWSFLFLFVPTASSHFTACQWEESGSFFIPSVQVFMHIDKIPPTLPFSRLERVSSLSSSSYERLLHALNHHCGPRIWGSSFKTWCATLHIKKKQDLRALQNVVFALELSINLQSKSVRAVATIMVSKWSITQKLTSKDFELTTTGNRLSH